MKQLKTRCDHCKKDLTPDKWGASDWNVYCSQECEQQSDKDLHDYFEKQLSKL